jgi:hypothetical protein
VLEVALDYMIITLPALAVVAAAIGFPILVFSLLKASSRRTPGPGDRGDDESED